MYGIPNMKLGKDLVDRRVDLLKAEGIEFVTNADVGRNIDAKKLYDEFDALILATGATRPRGIFRYLMRLKAFILRWISRRKIPRVFSIQNWKMVSTSRQKTAMSLLSAVRH